MKDLDVVFTIKKKLFGGMKKILCLIILYITFINASGPRRNPPVFNSYHTAELAPGQILYKMIPVNVLLTYDVDCSPVNGITPVPCEIYLIKNAQYFFAWFDGIRDPNGWFVPPTIKNVTSQTIQIRWPVPSFNYSNVIYFALINPPGSGGSISLTYNYQYEWPYTFPYWVFFIVLALLCCCCCLLTLLLLIILFLCLLRRVPKEYEPVDTDVRVF